MDRTANIGRELRALDRLVALLLVVARIAELAAASPYPVRCVMLWALRRADARAKDFAGRYAFWMGLPRRPVVTAFDGDDRDAALSLALSLRFLAGVIADMIKCLHRRHFRCDRPAGATGGSCNRLRSRPAAKVLMASCQRILDTS